MAAQIQFPPITPIRWQNLNADFPSKYRWSFFSWILVPKIPAQRSSAFLRSYMEQGRSCGLSTVARLALTAFGYPANWDWSHTHFSGQAPNVSNTWNLRRHSHVSKTAATGDSPSLPETFNSAPKRVVSLGKDLRQNPDIHILLSIDTLINQLSRLAPGQTASDSGRACTIPVS